MAGLTSAGHSWPESSKAGLYAVNPSLSRTDSGPSWAMSAQSQQAGLGHQLAGCAVDHEPGVRDGPQRNK
jgi:hypothetical protein